MKRRLLNAGVLAIVGIGCHAMACLCLLLAGVTLSELWWGRPFPATTITLTLSLALASVPAFCLGRRLRSWSHSMRQRREGSTPCPACGYDLRGTPSGGGGGSECPECGAACVWIEGHE